MFQSVIWATGRSGLFEVNMIVFGRFRNKEVLQQQYMCVVSVCMCVCVCGVCVYICVCVCVVCVVCVCVWCVCVYVCVCVCVVCVCGVCVCGVYVCIHSSEKNGMALYRERNGRYK
jgi:hypothetical protein